jgi:hypothetical protein
MEHPQLYLGLMGFDETSRAQVCDWIDDNAAAAQQGGASAQVEHPVWSVVDFQEADALLIRGAGVEQGNGSYVQFDVQQQPILPNTPLGADLQCIAQPFALSDVTRLQTLGIDTQGRYVVDLASSTSMLHTLQHFEAMLRPLCTLFTLAAEISARRAELDSEHTFHVERQGTLDAIIDPPQRRVLLRPGTSPVDINGGAWQRRPKSANFAPAHFVVCGMDELAWIFALHTRTLNLPKRYQSQRIYLRRNPRVRHSLLYSRHAVLLEFLCNGGMTLEQLHKALPDMARSLERDLFALYLVRSISTTAPTHSSDGMSSLPVAFSQTVSASAKQPDRRVTTLSADLQSLF